MTTDSTTNTDFPDWPKATAARLLTTPVGLPEFVYAQRPLPNRGTHRNNSISDQSGKPVFRQHREILMCRSEI